MTFAICKKSFATRFHDLQIKILYTYWRVRDKKIVKKNWKSRYYFAILAYMTKVCLKSL